MAEYRIVSDGIRWRIQILCHGWWRRKPKWKFCGIVHPDVGWAIKNYDSLEGAKKALRLNQIEDAAKARGYTVCEVKNGS